MRGPYIPQEIVNFLQSITIAELGYISQADYGWKADQHYAALKQIIFEQNCRVDESQRLYPGEVVNLRSYVFEKEYARAYVICQLLKVYSGAVYWNLHYDFFREQALLNFQNVPKEFQDLIRDALLINFEDDFLNKPCELLTSAQMAEADRITIESGVPGFTLMQNAGQAAADIIAERVQPCPVLVLCGPGNNGGDGFVIAALLEAQGWDVQVACCVPLTVLKGDARKAADLWDGPVLRFEDVEITPDLLVVDAVFGTGFRGAFRSPVLEAFQKIGSTKPLVIAVDIPSGVNGTTAEAAPFTPSAKLTVTFCRKKLGHVLYPGVSYCGPVVVADIGIPNRSVAQAGHAALENHNPFPKNMSIAALNAMAGKRAQRKRLVHFVRADKSVADKLSMLRERAKSENGYVIQSAPDFILATPEGELVIMPYAPQKARLKEIEQTIENILSGLRERGIPVYEAARMALWHVAHMGG